MRRRAQSTRLRAQGKKRKGKEIKKNTKKDLRRDERAA
jgi:hypothetical protein